jgi:threonine dehydratase
VVAHIFVPLSAPQAKLDKLRALGARVQVVGERYADALAASEQFIVRTGALRSHAYDQIETLAGQGTVALEWQQQTPDLDTVLIAVGGGGLIGGIAAWFDNQVKVVAVEPITCPTLHTALAAGRPVDIAVSGVAADSLGASRVGEVMFPIAQRAVASSVLVSDTAIVAAQHWLWDQLRIAAEPGGAAAMAALLSGAYRPGSGERVGVLICGANLDPASLTQLV